MYQNDGQFPGRLSAASQVDTYGCRTASGYAGALMVLAYCAIADTEAEIPPTSKIQEIWNFTIGQKGQAYFA